MSKSNNSKTTQISKYGLQKDGIRFLRRQPPFWMILNMKNGLCWCGKPKELWEDRQIKYCCHNHADIWFYSIRCYWTNFRSMVYRRDNYTCQECGLKIKTNESGYAKCDWEVDHILAISHGGACFDLENVRLLCKVCHTKKTASDFGKLAKTKKIEERLEFTNPLEVYS